MAVIGACKLCLQTGKLCNSHIMPRFLIRRIQHWKATGNTGATQPFLTVFSLRHNVGDGAKQGGFWEDKLGLREFLLCNICEGRLSVYENYVRQTLYLPPPGPLKKRDLGTFQAFNDPAMLGLRVLTPVEFDYKQLKLFQLSILWRASIAGGLFWQNVSVGTAHEEKLRQLLSADDPGQDVEYCCSMVDLRYGALNCEDWTQTPARGRDSQSNQRVYKVVLGGYLYVFHVAKEPPPEEIIALSPRAGKHMLMPVANPERLMRMWSVALNRAEGLRGGPID